MSSIVVPGSHKYFRVDLRSNEIIVVDSSVAFKKAAKEYFMIAVIDWDWAVNEGVSGTIALSGISESLMLDISVDLKEEIEDHLFIKRNDTIYLVYDFLADVEIGKDEEGKRMQAVTEYVVPRYLINPATNKAIKLNDKMEE